VNLAKLQLVSDDVGLQILLSRLLEMKAYLGEKRLTFLEVDLREAEISIRFVQPFAYDCAINHTRPSLPLQWLLGKGPPSLSFFRILQADRQGNRSGCFAQSSGSVV